MIRMKIGYVHFAREAEEKVQSINQSVSQSTHRCGNSLRDTIAHGSQSMLPVP
jgi:hypothetical protein